MGNSQKSAISLLLTAYKQDEEPISIDCGFQ